MKRYTKKEVSIEDGKMFVLCNAHEEDCDNSCLYKTCEWDRKSLLRLREYENTGITPKQILEMDRLYTKKCQELAACRKKISEILKEIEEIGNIQFSNYTKPLIAVEDVIRIIHSHKENNEQIPGSEKPSQR